VRKRRKCSRPMRLESPSSIRERYFTGAHAGPPQRRILSFPTAISAGLDESDGGAAQLGEGELSDARPSPH